MSSSELTNLGNLDEFKNLSEKELSAVKEILQQLSTQGNSQKLDDLKYADYAEIPVDIETFLTDKNYLGSALIDDEGRFTVFPYWVETFKKIFPTNLDTSFNTVILSGSIGIGKSFVAVICLLYMLYRMLCLKDPYKHFGLQPIDHITFSFINITMEAAKGVAWAKCQEIVQSSPWFLAHGRLNKSNVPEWQPSAESGIELIYGSQPRHVIGRAVYCSFEDEVSFQLNQDIEKQKQKAKALISSIDARMQSRFMKGEKLPTLHLIASSKRTDQSFLETYIDTKRKNESKTTLIIDEPQWVIRTDKDSPNKFWVAVGSKFLESEVVPLNATDEDLDTYRARGFSLLNVPMGYYEQFVDDLDIALTDIAGISTSNAMHYISGARWNKVVTDTYENPFTKEIIVVGDGLNDTTQYSDYFDLSKVPKTLKDKPLYIHLDMSVSGDKTGIGGVYIVGKKPTTDNQNQSKDLYYQIAFGVSIKAPKGHQISFEKNRNFIRWLKEQGFNIKVVSCDTYQSYDLLQQLKAEKFITEIISVDRVENKVCIPYQNLKSVIYEQRIKSFKCRLLTDELIGLVRDGNGKVDHSPSGINSKDLSDGICGACFSASKHAEEFAYDYGEIYDVAQTVNEQSFTNETEQINKAFEDELLKMFTPKNNNSSQMNNNMVNNQPQATSNNVASNAPQPNPPKSPFLDFGLGPAKVLKANQYISQGIIVF